MTGRAAATGRVPSTWSRGPTLCGWKPVTAELGGLNPSSSPGASASLPFVTVMSGSWAVSIFGVCVPQVLCQREEN